MADGRKNNGGHKSAGRKSKAEEQKVNTIFLNALKDLYCKKTDDDAKIAFIKELSQSQRGQIFIAEHLFGKPKETVDQNITLSKFNIKDIINFE